MLSTKGHAFAYMYTMFFCVWRLINNKTIQKKGGGASWGSTNTWGKGFAPANISSQRGRRQHCYIKGINSKFLMYDDT